LLDGWWGEEKKERWEMAARGGIGAAGFGVARLGS